MSAPGQTARSTVVARGRPWTVSGLGPRERGRVRQAVVVAQLVDDASGGPVLGPVGIDAGGRGLEPRVAGSGFVGLVGVPVQVFPGLATAAGTLAVEIGARGYESRHEQVVLPAQAGFPATFTAADLGVVRMRRLATVLTVATYELDAANRPQPLPGAEVRVDGWWAGLDALGTAPATTPLVALTLGLSAARPDPATVEAVAATAPAEPDRRLWGGVAPGAAALVVDAVHGLVPGDLVGLDLADPDRAERVEVTAVEGPADPLSPATLRLAHPLRTGHADATPVVRLTVPAPGAATATTVAAALEGDRTLHVTTTTGLPTGQLVRVSGGLAPPEYRTTARYDVVSDATGVARLPAVSGLAAVRVVATSGPLSARTRHTLTAPTTALDLTLG